MLVCASGSDDLVEWMIANSADVTMVDRVRGWTALHYAVARGDLKIVEQLIGKGGKAGLANVRDTGGKTAADICNNPAVRRLLESS